MLADIGEVGLSDGSWLSQRAFGCGDCSTIRDGAEPGATPKRSPNAFFVASDLRFRSSAPQMHEAEDRQHEH
jgi:hypothetical protein